MMDDSDYAQSGTLNGVSHSAASPKPTVGCICHRLAWKRLMFVNSKEEKGNKNSVSCFVRTDLLMTSSPLKR